jgi:hypothetical protein
MCPPRGNVPDGAANLQAPANHQADLPQDEKQGPIPQTHQTLGAHLPLETLGDGEDSLSKTAHQQLATKRCSRCKETLPRDQFHKDKSRKHGLQSQCKACMDAYRHSPKGKASLARYKSSPKGKASQARYAASPKGKASQARYESSPKGKASQARYAASPKGKASQARYKSSPKAKAYRAHNNARRYLKTTIPGFETFPEPVKQTLTSELMENRQ